MGWTQNTLETKLAFHLSIKHNGERGGKKNIKIKDLDSKLLLYLHVSRVTGERSVVDCHSAKLFNDISLFQ